MRSTNPVFARRGFRHHDATEGPAVRQPEPVGATVGAGPEGPTSNGLPAFGSAPDLVRMAVAQHQAMTIEDVTVRTGATLGTLVLAAALSWALLPVDLAGVGTSYAVGAGAALVAFLLAMVQTFRTRPAPALILGYAALEGVFLSTVSDATSTFIAPVGAQASGAPASSSEPSASRSHRSTPIAVRNRSSWLTTTKAPW